ncbi:disulfide bond formation protein DsbA [Bifidobacterium aemilianum]|uniref:Disulfide bond formation protein DsbA n=1 Tax=Bifidobacterium aemilianum TaxID=2493120 RepID=A0A366K692_9BIFI|nr:thioredoxin domain-containing protein [Bifidobacterium aemilianum]RBP97266.1 disulfide bond formation protein DsbA [Bifidobacterium aemilianum]
MAQGGNPQGKKTGKGQGKAARRARQEALARQEAEQAAKERRQQTIIGAVVVALAVILLAVIAFFIAKPLIASKIGKSADSTSTKADPQAYAAVQEVSHKPSKATKEGGFVISKNGYNKPVEGVPTIGLYSDPLCPGCGALNRQIDPMLKAMMNAGQINLEEHFMVGLDSLSTDEYSSRATGAITYVAEHDDDPNQLLDFVSNLFAEGFQPEEGQGYKSVSDQQIKEQALKAGVPQEIADQAFSREYQEWLEALQAYIPTKPELLNVSGSNQIKGKMTTPTITVNGHFFDQNAVPSSSNIKEALLKSIGLSEKQVGKTGELPSIGDKGKPLSVE